MELRNYIKETIYKYEEEPKRDFYSEEDYESYTPETVTQKVLPLKLNSKIVSYIYIFMEFIKKLFEEIQKDGLATYGKEEVNRALNNGAVERLLISDRLVRAKKGEDLLRITKQNNSEFTIINTMHEEGKKFEGIGGVGALLRFKI